MKNVNRRDLCVMLSALAAVGGGSAEAQAASEPVLGKSEVFPYDALPKKVNEMGGVMRPVTKGVLPTGEEVEVHETSLPAGKMPHPPHKHRHSEFVMIREGHVEFDMDGVKQRLGPGGVIFAASEKMHGLTNIGDVTANYFVVAIGRQEA